MSSRSRSWAGVTRGAYEDDGATLDNLRKAVTTLEETERTARRLLGPAPLSTDIELELQERERLLRRTAVVAAAVSV